MRKAILSISCLIVFITAFAQGQNETICRLGFTYTISQSNNWGKGKPIIQSITPYSPAESAGLKPFDIIEEIDGIPISQIAYEEIPQLLNPVGQSEVPIVISNIATSSKKVSVKKDCKKVNAITEDQLASAFAMYSLESTNERGFTCPFKTTVTSDHVDFAQFKTYAFADIDEDNQALESSINEVIGNELVKKGLKPDSDNPDIIIETFYFFDKNPNFKGVNLVQIKQEPVFRYNFTRTQMEKFPFLNPSTAETEVEYLLQLGIRFIDRKDVPGRILWECEANESLEESYRLDEYARVHIPLMCMQYPYVEYQRNVPFYITKKTYNYTGISYDIDNLGTVIDVDRNSPAYAAGIRPNDVIEKIGRHKMNHSTEDFSALYKRFVSSTMKYRDESTQFTDANGFPYCMLWDTFKYPMIADAMQKTEYASAFSYLYYFAPYVNPSGNNTCTFEIKRGKEKQEIIIRPTIRTEIQVEVK